MFTWERENRCTPQGTGIRNKSTHPVAITIIASNITIDNGRIVLHMYYCTVQCMDAGPETATTRRHLPTYSQGLRCTAGLLLNGSVNIGSFRALQAPSACVAQPPVVLTRFGCEMLVANIISLPALAPLPLLLPGPSALLECSITLTATRLAFQRPAGNDKCCCLQLAPQAGTMHIWHNCTTTPELPAGTCKLKPLTTGLDAGL